MISRESDVDDFIDILAVQVPFFIVNQYKAHKQYKFIKEQKQNLAPRTTILVQKDFAENYSCDIQNSIQSAYFNKKQVTSSNGGIQQRGSESSS